MTFNDNVETCTATANSTGRRCRRIPPKGSTVCLKHGAQLPQVRAKAAENEAIKNVLANEMIHGERRHPWEILLDVVHSMDVLMRDFRLKLDGSDELTVEQANGLIERLERAAKWAQTAINTRAHEWAAKQANDQGYEIALIINAAISRAYLPGGCEDKLRSALRSVFEDVANDGIDELRRRQTGETRYGERLLNAPQIEGTMLVD